MAIIVGTPGSDSIDGDPFGIPEDDILVGSFGNDTLNGLGGSDVLFGDAGFDRLNGGAGNDFIDGGSDNDTVGGGGGSDTLFGGTGNDSLLGGDGRDFLDGGDGFDRLFGGNGKDLLYGRNGDDTLFGEDGNDTLEGGAGFDFLDGGAGVDFLAYTQSPAGVLIDLLGGANAGGDAAGDVIVFASFENLAGSAFNDSFIGNNGANEILGGGGNDYLNGVDGNDTLRGDSGADTLIGGAGLDVFLYFDISDSPVATPDNIVDFLQGSDLVDLSAIAAELGLAALTFAGHNVGFSGAIGDVRSGDNGVDSVIEIDDDGDFIAEFRINVSGVVVFNAGDFIL